VRGGFWWGRLNERYRFEDLGVDERIILKWIFKKWLEDVDCMNLF
jgi:hypothetical protein